LESSETVNFLVITLHCEVFFQRFSALSTGVFRCGAPLKNAAFLDFVACHYMRIAIVSPVFPPYKGGIGNAAYAEALELANYGHDVAVFVPRPDKMTSFSTAFSGKFRLYQLTPVLRRGNAAFLPQLWRRLRDFDAVHLHYPFFGGAEVVYKLKIKSEKLKVKLKLVATYHHDVVGRGFLGRFFKWHTKHLMPKILGAADKIIVSSFDYAKNSNIKDIFEKYPEKFVEVPFGVDTKKFEPAPKNAPLLAKYNLKPDEKIILFVGGLDRAHYFKGLEFLIKSIPTLNLKGGANFKLMVVGDGDLKSYYEKMAADFKINDQIIFVGGVESDDLPKYYNLSDVVVLPSIDQSEAFGIVLIEAMACARPVIASNLPGVRSVIDFGINGFLVEPKSVRHLAEKINDVLYNPDICRQFGQNGRIKVLEKYSIEKMGEKLEKILMDTNNE
jgi:glycosyltransferase involved in cell wall biosynthesis